MALLLQGPSWATELTCWFSPNGTGNGSSSNTPRAFSASYINQTLLTDTSASVIRINLLPSTTDYSVNQVLQVPDRADRADLKVILQGWGTHPEEVRLVNTLAPSNGGYPHPDHIVAFNRSGGTAPLTPVQHLVVENLLLDGNWTWKLNQLAHTGVAQNYKNAPLNLEASFGTVRRVIVRNFGAVGFAPFHRFAGTAGVETFPFVVGGEDRGQALPTGNRRPWVVQQCEVHGFNSVYAGYTTELMAQAKVVIGTTPTWASGDTTRRWVTVQGCQFRSGSDGAFIISTGNAGESGRTTFTDNIMLNQSLGYNADTGKVRYVDITNSLGLGTWWWARIEATSASLMKGFNVSGNSLRFGPRSEYPTYRSFCWNASGAITDPTQILGRYETNALFSGAVLGAIDDVTFNQNQFTTIPAAVFDETDPGNTANALYRHFYKSPSTSASCSTPAVTYAAGSNYGLTGNKVSSSAWDFTSLQSLANGTYSSFDSTTFPALTTNRAALANAPSSFVPFGRVERVLPVWTNLNRAYVHRLSASTYSTNTFVDQALAGAHEVALGVPSIVSTNLQVPVRLVLQQTPMVGGGVTTPLSGKLVWVKATGAISSTQWATTDSTGLATVTLSISGVTHGEVLLTAFHDPRTSNGASGAFDEYQVAWARGTSPVGTVIQVVAAPDVAVDRREGSVQTAQFKLRRSGPAVVNTTNYPALDVSFELPQSSGNRTATLTTDYGLTAISPTTRTLNGNPVGPHTVRFAAGQTTALLTVTPVTDNVIEKEIVWLRLLTGSGYALGTRSEARTYIYDGPEWTLVEITHSQDPYSGRTRPAGLNNDLNGSSNPDPRVATDAYVMRTNSSGSPIYGYTGGSWRSTWTEPTALIDLTLTAPLSPIVTGISDTSSGSFRMSGWKGETGGGTRAIKADQTGWWYLTVPTSGQDEGWYVDQNKGLCISPNKNYVGGHCLAWRVAGTIHYEERPVGWNGTTFIDLGVEDFTNDNGGKALGVNDQGEFVGERRLIDESGLPTYRAFRTRPEGQAITTQDLLPPPFQQGVEDHEVEAIARAISPGTSTTSGIAVGDAVKDPLSYGNSKTRPVWWGSRTKMSGAWAANSRGDFGNVDESRSIQHAIWTSISINGSKYELYGWEKAEGESTTSAAWWPSYWEGSGVRLNDAYAVMGIGNGSTWKLFEIVDANNSRWLLGRATKNSSDRAVLLVPQTVQP